MSNWNRFRAVHGSGESCECKNGTLYDPLVPSIVGQAFVGGLGGGTGSQWGNFVVTSRIILSGLAGGLVRAGCSILALSARPKRA